MDRNQRARRHARQVLALVGIGALMIVLVSGCSGRRENRKDGPFSKPSMNPRQAGENLQADRARHTGIDAELAKGGSLMAKRYMTQRTESRADVSKMKGAATDIAFKDRGRQAPVPPVVVDALEPVKSPTNTDSFDRIFDNPYHFALKEPLSTFSIDVDTASYSNVRRYLNEGRLPPADAVRIEEMVNYFTYDLPKPKGEHPIALAAESSMCPWNPKHQLVRIGVQGKTIDAENIPPRNFVFLLDTSGSMNNSDRLPLLKACLSLLVKQMRKQDRVAMVAYAGSAGLVLPSTPGDQHEVILGALDQLHSGGSTNGGEGIVLAYQLAQAHFIQGGANRVILGTDGDFNVGVTSRGELVRLIEEKRKTGVYLSVLGFGMGNLKDDTIQQLAQHGNGQYAYIDSLAEGRKVFIQDIATLAPIARDVKIQVEFNPAWVQAYRLIGYENRLMRHQDFNDDTKDAGDMGAGHTVTALYEIVPAGEKVDLPKIDELKYQEKPKTTAAADSNDLLTVKLRYILPEQTKSRLLTVTVSNRKRLVAEASPDQRFAAAVAGFGMVLRDSKYKGTATLATVQELARRGAQPDFHGQRQEFLRLVQSARQLQAPQGKE